MRDPARIDRILALIAAKWREQPDTRLTQLLSNTAWAQGWREPDLYHCEDDVIERGLRSR